MKRTSISLTLAVMAASMMMFGNAGIANANVAKVDAACYSSFATADKGVTVVNNCTRAVIAHEYCGTYFQGDQRVAAHTRYHSTRTWWCTGQLVVRSYSWA
jgi:hypothetical protein